MWPCSTLFRWSPDAARWRILDGAAPRGIRVNGPLDLSGSPSLHCLPARLSATAIDVSSCPNLSSLPAGLKCRDLNISRTGVESLPGDLDVTTRVNAASCQRLRVLPDLKVESLILRGCVALESLPAALVVRTLDLGRCRRLVSIPDETARHVVHLDVSGCTSLARLPEGFRRLQTLDVSGCIGLAELPIGIRIRSSIDVADSSLPHCLGLCGRSGFCGAACRSRTMWHFRPRRSPWTRF